MLYCLQDRLGYQILYNHSVVTEFSLVFCQLDNDFSVNLTTIFCCRSNISNDFFFTIPLTFLFSMRMESILLPVPRRRTYCRRRTRIRSHKKEKSSISPCNPEQTWRSNYYLPNMAFHQTFDITIATKEHSDSGQNGGREQNHKLFFP